MGKARANQAPKVSRGQWVQKLHRSPARWDVLLHKLGEALARRYWYTQANFREAFWHLPQEELSDLGMFMAREFGRRQSYAAVASLAGSAKEASIFDLITTPEAGRLSLIDQIVAAGRDAAIDCLKNYLEIGNRCVVKRNHPDLELLRPRIEQTLRRFLEDHCMGEGELVPCLERPAASDEGYFPKAQLPPEPETESGNAGLDAYRLNVLVHDADDARTMLKKLDWFVMTDPMLAPEFTVELVVKLGARQLWHEQRGRKMDGEAEQMAIRERLWFTPCLQAGRRPVELFAERQLLASERQRVRLERWAREYVDGIWRLDEVSGEVRTLVDVSSGRPAPVAAEGQLATLPAGTLLRATILPWDDACLALESAALGMGMDVQAARKMLHPMRVRRLADEDDPRLEAGRRLVKVVHGAFVAKFGTEWAEFASMAELRERLGELHHHLMVELRLADGRQFADAWQDEVEMAFPAYFEEEVGEEGLDRPGVVYDERHGMALVPDAPSVRMVIQSPAPMALHTQALARLLLEAWRPGWLIERLATERPDRVEAVIRELIGDDGFDVERDLKALLGRWKRPQFTLPQRPTVFLGSRPSPTA